MANPKHPKRLSDADLVTIIGIAIGLAAMSIAIYFS
jgi:hypothetical protein